MKKTYGEKVARDLANENGAEYLAQPRFANIDYVIEILGECQGDEMTEAKNFEMEREKILAEI